RFRLKSARRKKNARLHITRELEPIPRRQGSTRAFSACEEIGQFAMNRRAIRGGVVDQLPGVKIHQHAFRAADMAGVSVGEGNPIELVDAACTKILPDDALVITSRSGIEQPVAMG